MRKLTLKLNSCPREPVRSGDSNRGFLVPSVFLAGCYSAAPPPCPHEVPLEDGTETSSLSQHNPTTINPRSEHLRSTFCPNIRLKLSASSPLGLFKNSIGHRCSKGNFWLSRSLQPILNSNSKYWGCYHCTKYDLDPKLWKRPPKFII